MNWASSEIVNILTFLLPGFVAGAIFHSLTSHPKPSEFERIFQALIFTSLIQAITVFILWISNKTPLIDFHERQHVDIILAAIIAVLMGLLASLVFNHDWLHALLRFIKITKEGAYPSVWYSSFFKNDDCYVVLHLQGDRRLYGWPEEWPSSPDRGHFRIADAEWLDGECRIPLEDVVAVVVPANDVIMVEYLRSR